MKKLINIFLDERYYQVKRNLLLVNELYDEQAIHDMRVAIKKIRALYRMFEVLSNGKYPAKSYIKELRKLFKAAALMRDAQVQLNLIEKYKQDSGFQFKMLQKKFKKQLKSGKKAYKIQLKNFDKKRVNKELKTFRKHLKKIDELDLMQNLVKSFWNNWGMLKQLRQNFEVEENIHQFRISLKEVLYLLDLVKMKRDEEFEGLFPLIKYKKLKAIASGIGEWHDRIILLEYIWEFSKLKNIKDEPEYDYLINRVFEDNRRFLLKMEKQLDEKIFREEE